MLGPFSDCLRMSQFSDPILPSLGPFFVLRVVFLAAQGMARCVCRGEVAQQLEWVLLDGHFALLQALNQQQPGTGKQAWFAQRCQALSALIRLTSITPCRELLDIQEKVTTFLHPCKHTKPV